VSRTFPPDTRPSPVSEQVPESPYMGLMPYSEADAPFFFGREKEIRIVIANLMASKLTVLYGTSGVGKSSMLRAGVVHQLQQTSSQDLARHRPPEFLVVYFSEWSNDPVLGLTNGVRKSIAKLDKNAADDAASAPERALAEVLHRWSTARNLDLFIVLDQFEEYFLYHSQEDGPGTFAVEFPRAVAQPDLRVNFLVAVREDSLAKLDRFKGHIPNLFGNYLRIRHLDLAAARMAVKKPLEEFNRRVAADLAVTVEPELLEALLEQVRIGKVTLGGTGHGVVDKEGDSPTQDTRIETPYLQLVLERLWSEELKRGSRVLTATTLRELGGAQRIVRTHLDEALANLQPPEQDIAAGIFHYLVTPSGMKISHTVRDLAEYAGLPEPRVTPVLERLSGDVRILRPVAPALDQSDGPSYEIFHDVLAPAILDWRARYQEVQAAEARLAKRLEAEAKEKRAAEERAQAYRRRARTTRAIAFGMAFLLLVMTALAVFAWKNWSTQKALARAGDLTARALSQASSDPAESLRLAAQGFDLSRTKDGEYALRQALSASHTRLILQGHKGSTTGVALSGDGRNIRNILTVSDDHTARIWEASTGRQLAIYDFGARPQWSFRPQFSQDGKNALLVSDKGKVMVWPWQAHDEPTVVGDPSDEASAAAFSPDPGGDRVVVGYTDGQVRVWTWRSPGKPVVLGSHQAWVNRVAFSPDGSRVATVGDDETARVWDWRTPKDPVILRGHQSFVVDLAFSPDGRLLATASWDNTARIWEWRSSKKPVKVEHDNWLNAVKFSHDGKKLVTASGDNTARVWDPRTGTQLARLDARSEVTDASFSPDGALVVTAELDGRARVWEASTAQSLMELLGHSDEVSAASFSPDGRSVVTASADNTARVWDVTTGRAFRGRGSWVLSAAFNHDGSLLVTASGDKTARVWDARTGRPIVTLYGHQNIVWSAAFSSDGKWLVTASDDGSVRVWKAGTGKVVARFGREEKGVRSAAFSPNGRFIVSVPWQSETATVWDWQSDSQVSFKLKSNTDAETGDITSAVFSPDNRFVLTAHESKIAQLWELGTGIGSVVRRFVGHQGRINSVAFSRDGARVVTASADRTARVWDTKTGKLIAILQGPTGPLKSASFDPTGRLVVAGSSDNATAIWRVDTTELLGILRMHGGGVNTATFSPDGKQILTASDDRTAKLYPCDICVPADQLLDKAREYQRLKYLAP
jgi:WD40 repeat protein